jgi:hypothetical protein
VRESGTYKWYFYDFDAGVPRKFTTDRLTSQIVRIDDPQRQSEAFEEFKRVPKEGLEFRVDHCYECKKDLDSRKHAPCLTCGWMQCPDCKACGCQYNRA